MTFVIFLFCAFPSCVPTSPFLSVRVSCPLCHHANTAGLPFGFLLPLRALGWDVCSNSLPWSIPPRYLSPEKFMETMPHQIQEESLAVTVSARQVMESGKQQPGLSLPKPRAPKKGLQPCLQASRAPHHLSIQGLCACLFLTEKTSCKVHPATDLLLSPSFEGPGLFCQACQCIRVRGELQAKRPSSYPSRLPENGSLLCCEKSSSQNSQPSGTSQDKAWGLACLTEPLGALSLSLWARGPSWGLARPRSRQAHASLSQSCIGRPISGSFGFGSFSMSAKIRALWNLILWQEASLWWLCGMRWSLARLLEELNPWRGT